MIVFIRHDLLRVLPVTFRRLPHVPHQTTEYQQKIGLALHIGALGIAEMDGGVFDDFRPDAAGCCFKAAGLHTALRVGVEIEVHAPVTVHSGVADHFPGLFLEGRHLHDLVKLRAEHVQYGLLFVALVKGVQPHADVIGHDG